MSGTSRNTPYIDVSICCIAKESDAANVREMLATLPAGVDVVILWNKKGEDNYVKVNRTQELSNGTLVRYLYYQWQELDFAELRNLCVSYAWRKWVLWLDADDRLLFNQHKFFNTLDIYGPGIGALVCGCIGNQPTHDVTNPAEVIRYHTPQPRLFRNGKGFKFEGAAHEQIAWSIQEKGYGTVDCSLLVHHVGYEVDADAMKSKMLRNVRALAREFVRCDDENKLKFWTKLLYRDSQNLNYYMNKDE